MNSPYISPSILQILLLYIVYPISHIKPVIFFFIIFFNFSIDLILHNYNNQKTLKMKKVYVLLGPPGAGKGTQAKILAQKLDLVHISTGDLLREEIKKESQLGKEAQKYVEKGLLVPDSLLNEIVKQKIQNSKKNVLLDGYPRNIPQAQALENYIPVSHLITIWLEIDKDTILERIKKRAKEENRLDDLNLDVIEKRLTEFNEKTLPLKEFYRKKGVLIIINGKAKIEEIHQEILKELSKITTI